MSINQPRISTNRPFHSFILHVGNICNGKGLAQQNNISYSETSNDRVSERQTLSVQQTKSMPLIALPITFGTSDKRTPLYSGQQTTSMPPKDSNLYKITSKSIRQTETKTTSTEHKKLWTFVAQIVCPLLCFVNFTRSECV